MLDPCCGSGHFLVSAFNLLVPLRKHEMTLASGGRKPPVADACDAVLQENLFGLELDPRCTQIAAFALALAAWKHPGEDGRPLGYRQLPPLNIACSGQGVVGKREDWQSLATGNHNLWITLGNLYDLFLKAPDLGSLIDPRTVLGAPGLTGTLADVQPLLAKALAKQAGDADLAALGVAAQGIAKAAEFLTGNYSLVITNVPFLGRSKQHAIISEYAEQHYSLAKHDLATVFLLRSLDLVAEGGTVAVVIPQNWMFLGTYTKLRKHLIESVTLDMLVKLGPAAFQDMNWWAANTSMVICSSVAPTRETLLTGVDVSANRDPVTKSRLLMSTAPVAVSQANQLLNPDCRIQFEEGTGGPLLEKYASGLQGVSTADLPRFVSFFWELAGLGHGWHFFQGSADDTIAYGGRECVLNLGSLELEADKLGAAIRGRPAWGKRGVVVRQMRHLPATLYSGEPFDTNVAVILPKSDKHLLPIWAFCSSPNFHDIVRKLDQKTNVTNATLVKVPFDLEEWTAIAKKDYPHGFPAPNSVDPTQWLFKGEIASSTDPLQVAVARLLGYRWPEQPKEADPINKLADKDGIVCIPAVRSKPPAAERLLEVLRAAYPSRWTTALLDKLLTDTGCKAGTTLDDWLRNQFFEQHCKRFHQRPFIWHIWDGRRDGFSCLVNYHKLDYKALENLTYALLQDWITAQANDTRENKTGADLRLKAARDLQDKLKLILTGEPPYDIFIRWKPLSEQPIGWNPDLNDGVRLNIRPFVTAGVLRKNPNIKWTKDRGKDPESAPWYDVFGGDRINDHHLKIAEKQAARQQGERGA